VSSRVADFFDAIFLFYFKNEKSGSVICWNSDESQQGQMIIKPSKQESSTNKNDKFNNNDKKMKSGYFCLDMHSETFLSVLKTSYQY